MAEENSKDRTLAMIAAGVAVIALGAATALALTSGGDDADPTPAAAEVPAESSPEAEAPPAAEPEPVAGLAQIDPGELEEGQQCRFKVASAVLRPDPETARGWQEIGLAMRPIAPAVGTPTGVEFKVTSSTRIDCDLHRGVLGTRGGMGFALGDRSLDLRRTRLDFGNGLMRMFPRSSGFDGIDASGLTLGDSSVVQNGNEVTVIVPLRATPDVAGQMNLALGQEVFSGEATVGTFHLVGERRIIGGA